MTSWFHEVSARIWVLNRSVWVACDFASQTPLKACARHLRNQIADSKLHLDSASMQVMASASHPKLVSEQLGLRGDT